MSKKQKSLIAILVIIAVSMMASSASAREQYRQGPVQVGPGATQPITPASEKTDLANTIDDAGAFVGDTAGTIGVGFGRTVESTGEILGGIVGGIGDFIGGTLEFIFGGGN